MDSISNMIIMIKNASLAGRDSVTFPYSKVKNAILTCLEKEGYIKQFSKKTKKDQAVLEVELLYDSEKRPKITEAQRISKQSRRIYYKIKDVRPVRGGSGLLVLSTPKGILSGRVARREQVGGEALFRLW
jgi:small subunit ribosomal protein S8